MEARILASTEMVCCPINANHEMLRKNLVKHLLKCVEQNGGKEAWAFCPYNMAHCVPKTDLLEHVQNCCDKVEIPLLFEDNIKVFECVSLDVNEEDTECWYY